MADLIGTDGQSAPGRDPRTRPGVRYYTILCLVEMVILTLLLIQEGYGAWSALPLLVGSVGVVAHWSMGPTLVLLCLASLLMRPWIVDYLSGVWNPAFRTWYRQEESSLLIDLLMAAVVLIHLASSYRLLSLVRHAVPPDPRRKQANSRVAKHWLLPKETTARTALAIPSNEILALLASVPAFLLGAFAVWLRLAYEDGPRPLDVPLPLWRVLLLIWGGGILMAAAYALLSYLGRAQASREESLLYLQDQLWAATRGEQRNITQWATWARLRKQRKEDKA